MGNFQKGGNRGGGFRGGNDRRPSFGGGFRGGNDRGGDVTMHRATCSECGKSCEVPFRPSGDKPVFCNDCFSNKREGGDRAPRKDFANRVGGFTDRPVTRTDMAPQSKGGDDMKKQLSDINSKLDRLVSVLEKMNQPKGESAPATKFTPVGLVKPERTPIVKADLKKLVTKAVTKSAPAKTATKKTVVKKASAPKKVVAKKKK